MNTFKALKIKDEGNFSIHDWAKKESKKAMDERERERYIYKLARVRERKSRDMGS